MSRLKYLVTACMLALTAGTANAAVIYSEDFNNLSFQGVPFLLGSTSDKFGPTNYYHINNFDGWTFSSAAYYALNASSTDGAVLLNENFPGGTASTVVTGLSPGAAYILSFLVSGDNEPGGPWQLHLALDGTTLLTVNGIDQASGTNPGTTETVSFTAAGTSALLLFSQTYLSPASPIIDNVEVSGTPLPAALPLFASGLGALGLLGWRRKRKATALAT